MISEHTKLDSVCWTDTSCIEPPTHFNVAVRISPGAIYPGLQVSSHTSPGGMDEGTCPAPPGDASLVSTEHDTLIEASPVGTVQ